MTELSVAALQMAMVDDLDTNIASAERLVRDAAAQGARIILIPELFEGPYFCKDQLAEHLELARPLAGHPTIEHFARLAAELDVVLPLSVYERAGQALFNTVVVVDAGGSTLGHYRKSHIPDGPGYTEKYYFSPATPDFECGRRSTERLVSASVGTSGSLRRHARWRCSEPMCCSIRRRSEANLPTPKSTPAAIGSG